jgi:hypothetical protein
MIEPPERRVLLTRMEVAQAETQRHLGIIERQIAARAERLTIRSGEASAPRPWRIELDKRR